MPPARSKRKEGEHRRRSPATCGGGRKTDGAAGARAEEIGAERGARFIAQETEGTRGGTVAWRARRAQAVHGTAAAPRHGGSRGASSLTGRPGCSTMPLFIFQIFFNRFKFGLVKRWSSVAQNFKIKYGRVDNETRNKFPYRSFSKFETEFDLKIREPN
jgi:hypothetical protein